MREIEIANHSTPMCLLGDRDLDAVSGGADGGYDGGCTGPWRWPDGTIRPYPPGGYRSPWLPGGARRG